MSLRNKSLRFRILFIVTLGTSILFSVLIAMSVKSLIQSQTEVAQGKLSQIGFEIASEVETQMNLGFQSSKDLSHWVLEAAKPGSKMDLNETTIASIFYSVLQARPAIFGIWIELEKPFVDQKTKLKLQRKKASKEHPRYIIYWTKNLKGEISDNAVTDNDLNVDETYFTNAIKAGRDVATDPYIYPVDGKDVLMVSLTQPLKLDGLTAGVGGVDIDIASLQKLTEEKTIFDGAGDLGIISSSGQIVALSGRADQINKTIWKSEQLEKWSQERWVEDSDHFRVVKKVKLGNSDPWYVISSVPRSIVYAPIKTASLQMITVSVLMLVVFIALLSVIISGLSQRLATVTQQLDQSGKDVSQISENIQTAAGDLSAASSEAASSIEETSAAVEELSSTLQLSSDNASKVKNLSNECVISAQRGQKQVDGLSENIQKISLGSKKMEEITSVIDDIAFQTNLLALNAAVEAARAGEHGRGFSVVADAVRSLAQKCSTSAKEISDLIRINVQQINEGSSQMAASRESLKQIVQAVEKVDALNSEIASMAKEQAVGISNINLAVQQLDTVTQKNAQASEGAELSSQALAAQSQNLYRYVQEITGVVLGEKDSQG